MKIEWLVAGVTAVGSLDRAERAIFGGDFDWVVLFVDPGHICGWGAT